MSQIQKLGHLQTKARIKSEKRSKRKEELGQSAIAALKQLGYARTSLRDIAQHSGVSVGMLHYYFEDKVDLISYCVRKYKEAFISDMDAILDGASDSKTVTTVFARGLSDSIRDGAQTHRLWYDIRTQAMFDESFQDVVVDIEQGLVDLIRRLVNRLGALEDNVLSVYMNLDGVFRYYLQRHLLGDETAVEEFHKIVSVQLGQLTSPVAAK